MVRVELTWISPLDFESSASTISPHRQKRPKQLLMKHCLGISVQKAHKISKPLV
jgi:hypothetical protein